MKPLCAALISLMLVGCAPALDVAKRDQLLLNVPAGLLDPPEPLKQL